MKRHPKLSGRQSRNISTAREKSLCRLKKNTLFQHCAVCDENRFQGRRTYTVDKSGFSAGQKKKCQKVIAVSRLSRLW